MGWHLLDPSSDKTKALVEAFLLHKDDSQEYEPFDSLKHAKYAGHKLYSASILKYLDFKCENHRNMTNGETFKNRRTSATSYLSRFFHRYSHPPPVTVAVVVFLVI